MLIDLRNTERYATAGAARVRCAGPLALGTTGHGAGARANVPSAAVIAPWSFDRKAMTQVDTHLPRPPELTP